MEIKQNNRGQWRAEHCPNLSCGHEAKKARVFTGRCRDCACSWPSFNTEEAALNYYQLQAAKPVVAVTQAPKIEEEYPAEYKPRQSIPDDVDSIRFHMQRLGLK